MTARLATRRRCCAALLTLPLMAGAHAERRPDPPAPTHVVGRVVREGVDVELTLGSAGGASPRRAELVEGADATVRFRIRDAATGKPLAGLRPLAWLDLRRADPSEGTRGAGRSPGRDTGQGGIPGADQDADAQTCHAKIQSFLQGSLGARPSIDLNSYHLLALNQEANVSVIDPLSGYGGSKLLTLMMLKSPGEDWVLTRDRKRLFVSMPLANQIAVIDTGTWKVVNNVDAGFRPGRLALQSDGKYLWTVNGDGHATAIDAATLGVAARIPVGAGPHDLLATPDDRHVFVTNRAGGTVSVIDVGRLAKVKDIPAGRQPAALAYSSLARAVYVGSEGDGTIAAIDSRSLRVVSRIAAKPGLHAIRFVPGGRYGLAANRANDLVHVFDAATNRLLRDVAVGEAPDQIGFTETFAYVRSAGTAQVSMIRLATLDKVPDVTTFPAGQVAPDRATGASAAPAIVAAPEGGAVYVANPSDRIIYYYAEGMAAPKGSMQNYRREPRAVLVVDKSLREVEPGVYATDLRIPDSGRYDVAFLLDVPRLSHCFTATVDPDPNAAAARRDTPVGLEYLVEQRTVPVGEPVKLRFRLSDRSTRRAHDDLRDVRVLAFLAPGTWQARSSATPVGDGVYEVDLSLPRAGVYYVFVEAPSLRIRYNQFPALTLQVPDRAAASGETEPERKNP